MVRCEVVLPVEILVHVDCYESDEGTDNSCDLAVQVVLHPLLVAKGRMKITIKERDRLGEEHQELKGRLNYSG